MPTVRDAPAPAGGVGGSGRAGCRRRPGPVGCRSARQVRPARGGRAGPPPQSGRPAAGSASPLVELLVVLALYACYTGARLLVVAAAEPARHHAEQLLGVERLLHLDVETDANAWVSGHRAVALTASYWYAALHYTVTPLVLVALRARAPRATYRRLRNALLATTMLALLGYAAFPTMPPRLLGGYDDVLAQTARAGWWGDEGSAPRGVGDLTNQFAAMPSMHVGWAVWCALAVGGLAAGRRTRLLVWAYPLGTTVVVVATGNHYLLDAVAGAALVLAVAALVRARRRTVAPPRLFPRPPSASPVRVGRSRPARVPARLAPD